MSKWETIKNLFKKKRSVQVFLFIGGISILVFASFWRAINFYFWDDDYMWLWFQKCYPIGISAHGWGVSVASARIYLLWYKILQRLFGLQAEYFNLTAIICYILAALSIYFFTLGLANNKKAAVISSFIFASGYIGCEAITWTWSAASTIIIILVSFFVYFWCQSLYRNRVKYYFLSLIFFTLSIILLAYRMHGIFIIGLCDFLWWLDHRHRRAFAVIAGRLFSLLLILIILGQANILMSNMPALFSQALGYLKERIFTHGQFDLLLYPAQAVGYVVMTTQGWTRAALNHGLSLLKISSNNPVSTLLPYSSTPEWLNTTVGVIFPSFILLVLALGLIYRIRKSQVIVTVFLSVVWLVIFLAFYYVTPRFFDGGNPAITALHYAIRMEVAGFFILFAILLYSHFHIRQPQLARAMLFSAAWIPAFHVFTFIFSPLTLTPSFHRYLIFPFVGYAAWVGITTCLLISGLERQETAKRLLRILLYLFIGVIIINNVSDTNKYCKDQANIRNARLTRQRYTYIKEVIGDMKEPTIIYAQGENNYHISLLFDGRRGYPYGLLYNIKDPEMLPVVTQSLEEVYRNILDGKTYRLNNVYSFYLNEDFTVQDTTKETRAILRQALKKGKLIE